MAAPNTTSTANAQRADLNSGVETPQTPVPGPGASQAAGYRVPGNEWIMSALFITIVVTALGFLVVSFGLFVAENAAVWIGGLIAMNVGVIGWTLVASYMAVAYIRAYFASRRKSGR